MMWRWQSGKFLKTEKRIDGVEIDGRTYVHPIAALRSGNFSFSKVFRAWREAVRPEMTDLTMLPTNPADAAERAVKRLSISIVVKEDGQDVVKRVKLLESREALEALVKLLNTSSLWKEIAGAETAQEIKDRARESREARRKLRRSA
jgi:hypothetical protein